MLVKFLARGTESAGAAAGYLLGERDAAGKPREGVEVLRGNPDMVAAVADTLAFEHRYTSGVIAWAPEDRPTDEQDRGGPGRLREDRAKPCEGASSGKARRTKPCGCESSGWTGGSGVGAG